MRLRLQENWQTIVGRRLDPSAYDPDEPWSRDVFQRRLDARLAAVRLAQTHPERVRQIIRAAAKH